MWLLSYFPLYMLTFGAKSPLYWGPGQPLPHPLHDSTLQSALGWPALLVPTSSLPTEAW